jgi:hypothetical protein
MANPDKPPSEHKPPSEPSPAEDDRPVFSLDRDDRRLLWITFLGGAAGVVVGAGVIGFSFGLAHFVVHSKFYGQFAIITGAMFAVTVGDLSRNTRTGHQPDPPQLRAWMQPVRVWFYCFAALVLLVWIGVGVQMQLGNGG